MSHFIPSLACGGTVISNGTAVLILSIIAGWFVAAFLCIANLVLIFRTGKMAFFRIIHSALLVIYVGLAILLFNIPTIITNNYRAGQVGMVMVIAIPLMVLSHFIYLLICWRRFKRKSKTAAKAAPVTV